MADVSTERRIAQDLLDVGAVSFSPGSPFEWASGLLSPVYCDNRMTLGHPDVRRRIRDAFAERIRREKLRADLVAGTATAGIPHAAWLAEALDLPMVYVRSRAKEHGTGSQIEGPVDAGRRAIVIEDLVSTGGSSLSAVNALRSKGVIVLAVLAIFSYGLPQAETAFSEAGVPHFTLTSFEFLLESALSSGNLDARDAESIATWRKDPWKWTERRRTSEVDL